MLVRAVQFVLILFYRARCSNLFVALAPTPRTVVRAGRSARQKASLAAAERPPWCRRPRAATQVRSCQAERPAARARARLRAPPSQEARPPEPLVRLKAESRPPWSECRSAPAAPAGSCGVSARSRPPSVLSATSNRIWRPPCSVPSAAQRARRSCAGRRPSAAPGCASRPSRFCEQVGGAGARPNGRLQSRATGAAVCVRAATSLRIIRPAPFNDAPRRLGACFAGGLWKSQPPK